MLACLGIGQIVSSTSAHPVSYHGIQQPGYMPFVPPPPSSVIPLSPFCSSAPNSSAVIPGVVAYPNPLMAPVSQLPPYTQVPPPTLQWLDASRPAFMPPNACMRFLPGMNVPKVSDANLVVLPSSKPNWTASERKSKVISVFEYLTFYCMFAFSASMLLVGFFSCKTCVSQHQKGKPFRILKKQEMIGWQWHQPDNMQIICTLQQTENHASTSTLSFYRLDALPTAKPIASKH